MYNGSSMSREEMESLERILIKAVDDKQSLKKNSPSPPKHVKCLTQQTINVLASQNDRFNNQFVQPLKVEDMLSADSTKRFIFNEPE